MPTRIDQALPFFAQDETSFSKISRDNLSYQSFNLLLEDVTVLYVMSFILIKKQYFLELRVLGGDFKG